MSTPQTNTFEAYTDGQFITVATSGGDNGTPFTHVISNNVSVGSGNGNVVAQGDIVGRGTRACKMAVTAGSSYLRAAFAETGTRYVARRWVHLESVPSANFVQLQLYTGTTLAGSVQITPAAKVQAYRGSTSLAAAGLSATVLATGKGYWVEFAISPETGDGTANNGIIEFAIFDSDGTTLIETKQVTGQDTGVITIDTVRFGGHGSASGMLFDYIDDPRWEAKTSGWIGPVANTPPTVSCPTPVVTVNAGGAVALEFIANDPDGTISSRATTFDFAGSSTGTGAPALTGGTTSKVSFTAGAAGTLYLVRHTVTDNAGATASVVVEVRVPTSATLRPLLMDAVATSGTWTKTGAATDGGTTADEVTGSYNESQALTSAESWIEYRLQPGTTRSALDNFTLELSVDTGTASFTIYLRDGSTTRQTYTQTVTSTPTPYNFTVSNPAAITDWGNLRARVGARI